MRPHEYCSKKGRAELRDYTFAVAKIRELENELITQAILDRLIEAENENEVISTVLSRSKFEVNGDRDLTEFFKSETLDAWETVSSLAPDSSEIKSLTVLNDFHNVKAALKALVMKDEVEKLYLFPTAVDTETFFENVRDKRYYELPKYIRQATENGYSVLIDTVDGQLLDSYIDSEAMKTLKRLAEKSNSDMFKEYTEFFISVTDIKIAYRGARADKGEKFFLDALCESDSLDIETLVSEALKGEQSLLTYIENSVYKEAAEKLKISLMCFEKYIDDGLTDITEQAKTDSFSVDPLFAYYHAKQTDIKNVRMILTCKQNSIEQRFIRERLRKTYV